MYKRQIQCGAEIRPEEAYHVAEEAVCPSCAETDTVVCSYCGERIWRENDFGDSDTALCEACYTNHYTRCSQCGRLISFSAAYYQDEDEDEETPYCSACYHECGEAIRCYSYKPVPIFHGDAPMYMGVELEVDDLSLIHIFSIYHSIFDFTTYGCQSKADFSFKL